MKYLLRYRKIVWVFLVLLIFTGIFTYIQLPKRDIPEISQNIASISTVYPGAAPSTIEQTVTNPLESALDDINGISEISSASTTGFATLTLSLESDIDAASVYSNIRQTVAEEAKGFPDEVQTPSVSTDLIKSNVATYHLLADDQATLYNLRDQLNQWEQELTSIAGVESLLIKGLPDQELKVSINPEELKINRIQPNQVLTALNNAISPKALGSQKEDGTQYQLSIRDYENIDDLQNIYITTNPSTGEAVYLSDVASINRVNQAPSDIIQYEGQHAISITLQASEGVNIEQVQQNITDKIDTLSTSLPKNVSIDQFYTQSTVINEVYSSLITSFVISLIAVLIIMLLGLPFSSALLVAIAIPLSIIIGLIPLPYAGVDLNQISIIGIIVAIGILVDDAIVVNDNIQRRFQLGESALKGTINGVREVGVSIVTSTLMIVFSFFPLTFLSGSNGDFIRALPLALICTVVASTILALTLIPTIQYTKQKNTDRNKQSSSKKTGILGSLFNKLEKFYADSIIPATLKKPWLTVISGIVLCLLLLLLVFKVPFEFFPAADRAEVTISARLASGTTIEDTQQKLQEMEKYLLEKTDTITETVTYTGDGLPGIFSSSMTRTGDNTGQLVVRVNRDTTSASDFIDEWESPLREAFPEAEIFLETIVSGPPPSPSVEVKVQGPDIDRLVTIADDLKTQLADLDSAKIVTSNTSKEQNYITYHLDRELLAEEGVDPNQIIQSLQLANIGAPLGTFDNGTERLPLQLILDEGDNQGIDLSALTLAIPNENGPPETISYDSFITKETSKQIGAIPHYNGERTITIEGYEQDGEGEAFSEEANTIISSIESDLPDGYQIIEEGASSAESEFFIEVAKLFLIVLFLIYLTIAIQFNSLLTPLLITSTVLLAITGAIVGLFVSGEPLSFLAVLGIVSLSGIVVRNSILLIEFIEQNRNRYDTLLQAIKEAGRARVRPIILTTLTSIAALVPIIFTGDVLFRPLAISIVYGLLFSTILTLVLLPAIYATMKRMSK